jgi:PAS domain S-box-containing protein
MCWVGCKMADKLKLEDLVDISLLQSLQEKLDDIYSFPSAIIDNEGKILTAVAWQDICTKFHRKHPETQKECIKSDLYILENLKKAKPSVSYQCPLGLIDIATPIIIDSNHLGNFFTGQFFYEEPDKEYFKKQAIKYGFDENEYMEAVSKVPIIPKEKVDDYLNLIISLIQIISDIGSNTLNERKVAESIKEEKKKSKESELLYRLLAENISDGIVLIEDDRIKYISPGYAKILGHSSDYLSTIKLGEIYSYIHPDDRERTRNRIAEAHKNQTEHYVCIYRLLDANGNYIWIEDSINSEYDSYGKRLRSIVRATDITDKKEDEISLQQSEEKFKALFESSPDAIILADRKTGIIKDANLAVERLFETKIENIIGLHQYKLHPERLQNKAVQSFQSRTNKKDVNVKSLETEILTANKNIKYVEIRGSVISIKNNEYVLGVFKDISEEKIAKESLAKSEGRYKQLVETASDAIYLMNDKGIIIDTNFIATQMLQRKKDDIIGSYIDTIDPNYPVEVFLKFWQDIPFEKQQIFETTHQKKNGDLIPIEISGKKFKIADDIFYYGVARDITERKTAEQKIIESEEKFRTYVENASDIIYQISPKGELIYVSPNWKEILGHDISEVEGNKFTKFVHSDDIPACYDFLNKVFTTGIPQSGIEYRVKHKTKGWMWHVSNVAPLKVYKGRIVSYIGIARDITNEKEQNKAIEEVSRRYQTIIKNFPNGAVFLFDKSHRYIHVEGQALKGAELDPKKMVGKTVNDIFPKEVSEIAYSNQQLLLEGKNCYYEVEFAGNIYANWGTPIYNENGDITEGVIFAHDISDIRNTESKLNKNQKEFQTWIQNTPVCTKKIDLDFNLQFMSEAGIRELKVDNYNELLGAPYPFNFFPEDFQKEMSAKMKEVREKCEVAQIDGILSDTEGKRMWYSHILAPVMNSIGELDYILIISSDISERKRAEEELKEKNEEYEVINEELRETNQDLLIAKEKAEENEKKFKGIFDNANIGIATTIDGVFTNVNEEFEKILGYNLDELKKMTFEDFTHPDDLDKEKYLINKLLNNEIDSYKLEKRYIRKDKIIIWVDLSIAAMKDNKSDFNLYIAMVKDITERKKAESELKNSLNRFTSLVENIQSGVFYINTKGEILEINPGMLRILGSPSKEATKQINIFKFQPLIEIGYVEKLKKCLENKTIVKGEAQYISKWGKEAIVNYYFVPIIENNEVVGILANNEDVTEKRKSENALIESEQRLKLASQSAELGIWDLNIKENILVWDKRMFELYGVKEDTGIKTIDLWMQGLHPEDKERAIAEYNDAVSGISDFNTTFRVKHPDGTVLYINGYGLVLRDNDGKAVRMIGVNRDVTENKLNELELRRAKEEAEDLRERFDYATSISELGTWDWDLEKDDLIWSSHVYRILGFEPYSVPPSYDLFMSRIHPDDLKLVELNIQTSTNQNLPYNVDYRIIVNNEVHICNSSGKVEYDKTGKPVRMLGTFQDITQRKKIENELLIAKEKAEESSRLKTEFLHNMSHEIRTPMNGIMGFSELLLDPEISYEEKRNFSKIIKSSSKQLLKIIDDILEISVLETKQENIFESEFSLNDLMLELFSIFNLKSKERDIPIYLKKPLNDEQSYIVSDRVKLNKILSNLLENAIRYTNEGFIEFGYAVKEDILKLYVKDTGIGIDPKNHKMIFERFSQENKELSLKHGGLGLGLAISKESAMLLGGDISVESEKGKGSTFYLTIPFKPSIPNVSQDVKRKVLEPKPEKKYTVLIAEDEEVNYLYLETILKKSDIKINLIHARNGKEAVDICMENNKIDIVLMDIKMPVMNGLDATKEIKEKSPELPVIAQTAYSTVYDQDLAISYGCDDFISKPIKKDKLFDLMNKYLV